MQHNNRSGGVRGVHRCHGGREKALAQRAGYDFRLHPRFPLQDPSHGFNELRLPDYFDQRPP
jgi:hypothetical protein